MRWATRNRVTTPTKWGIRHVYYALIIVAIVMFLIIWRTHRGKRIFSRPEWDFHKDQICKKHLENTLQPEDLTTGHQLPSRKHLCSMTFSQIEHTYAMYFNNIQTICGNLQRFGQVMDGGWDVCLDEDLIKKNDCLVYSFGIDFEFSFDDEISERWGCMVHSFDPSMNTDSYRRSSKIQFHNWGLSNVNGTTPDANWKMLTFQGVRAALNHEKVIPDVIKMDIEDWEWHVIPEMLASRSLNGVKQFLVEFHFSNIPEADSEVFWVSKFFLLKDVYAMGFRITWATRNLLNVWRSRTTGRDIIGCFEVSFIRRL